MLPYLLTDQGFSELLEARGLVSLMNSPRSNSKVAADAWLQLGKVAQHIQTESAAHDARAAEAMGRTK